MRGFTPLERMTYERNLAQIDRDRLAAQAATLGSAVREAVRKRDEARDALSTLAGQHVEAGVENVRLRVELEDARRCNVHLLDEREQARAQRDGRVRPERLIAAESRLRAVREVIGRA